jgi:hypothetical protein
MPAAFGVVCATAMRLPLPFGDIDEAPKKYQLDLSTVGNAVMEITV